MRREWEPPLWPQHIYIKILNIIIINKSFNLELASEREGGEQGEGGKIEVSQIDSNNLEISIQS